MSDTNISQTSTPQPPAAQATAAQIAAALAAAGKAGGPASGPNQAAGQAAGNPQGLPVAGAPLGAITPAKVPADQAKPGGNQAGPPAVPGPSQMQPAGQQLPANRGAALSQAVSKIFFKGKVDDVDLQYMTEVDAALRRRGNPRAFIMSAAVLLFFICFLVWASIAQLDEVTRGTGQVISALPIQEIQNLEGGVLERIDVRAGDTVEKGQVLASIANVRASSDLQRNIDQQGVLRAMVIRLQAERDGSEPVFPEDLRAQHPDVVAGQMDLYRNHVDQRESEMRALESQLEQRQREVQEAQARQKSLTANLRLAIEQRDRVKPLADKGIYAPIDFLRLEQSVVSLRGDLDSVIQTVSRTQSAVEEAEERITSRRREWMSTIQEEYNTRVAALNEVTSLIAQGTDTVNRKEVRSPVKGKVKQIMINTIGGTVPPGATIMEILPIDENLLIEARISPNDRAFLRTSDDPAQKQQAVVKITAYDFSIYGGLEATLEYISDDTIEDKRGEVFFEVRLLTKSNAIMFHGEALPIMPGMTAQVDILTGKKSVLSYLMKPIIKAKQNAFSER